MTTHKNGDRGLGADWTDAVDSAEVEASRPSGRAPKKAESKGRRGMTVVLIILVLGGLLVYELHKAFSPFPALQTLPDDAAVEAYLHVVATQIERYKRTHGHLPETIGEAVDDSLLPNAESPFEVTYRVIHGSHHPEGGRYEIALDRTGRQYLLNGAVGLNAEVTRL